MKIITLGYIIVGNLGQVADVDVVIGMVGETAWLVDSKPTGQRYRDDCRED